MLASCALARAQQATPSHNVAPPSKRYCQPAGRFCFQYPAAWSVLGEIFDGNGVVVAPPQKKPRELWDSITVAGMDAPGSADDHLLGLDEVVDRAAVAMRDAGEEYQTLQRQHRLVDSLPAQMLKARYREKGTEHDWIEEIVFIQGLENEIYSVSLKCAPQNLAGLQPALSQILRTWKPAETRSEESQGNAARPQPPASPR